MKSKNNINGNHESGVAKYRRKWRHQRRSISNNGGAIGEENETMAYVAKKKATTKEEMIENRQWQYGEIIISGEKRKMAKMAANDNNRQKYRSGSEIMA
jgi:hypothetical protein